MKILIVGGVAGGAGAAVRLRRLSETDEIIMFERTPYISYANCGLPYYIGEVITEREKLLVQTAEGLSKRFNLDIRVSSEVVSIDKDGKKVSVKNLVSGEEYVESYDKLILSPGAKAIIPPIENIKEAKNVFTLKDVPDADAVYKYMEENDVKRAVVVGAGFIGVETAENLIHRGLDVALIDFENQVMPGPADFEMAQYLHQELVSNGVELVLSDLVTKVSTDGKKVYTKNGKVIDTDIIIMSVGVRPASDIAVDAGLEVFERTKAIVVDENFATSDKDIYAVGDAIMQTNNIDKDAYVALAWGANRQARQLADGIHGRSIKKDKIKGASIIKVFDKTYASVGISEKRAKAEELDFDVVYATRGNHAGYYPGSAPIVLKLVFDAKTQEIYGAQGVGGDGVDKRIDVISTAMRFGAKVTDLSSIELCYSPQFNSAKDPVNILGYIAENVMEGVFKPIQHHEIDEIVENGGKLIDVRTKDEYELGHVEGAELFTLDEIRANIDKLPKDKKAPIYVSCQIGHKSYIAIQILRKYGYENLYNLVGGYGLYRVAKSVFKKREVKRMNVEKIDKVIDCCGMQCPGPIMATKKSLDEMKDGETIKITSSDIGYMRDVESWCEKTGNVLVDIKNKDGKVEAVIAKGKYDVSDIKCVNTPPAEKATTMVVFSGDLDKVIASMIIANGSAALGHKVTMFFTFWGLNALRKENAASVKKPFLDKMFGWMMPKGINKLKLSKMNMMGMGTSMMKYTMNKKNVDSLGSLLEQAKANGVEMIACTMSMDVMGIKEEELIDGISLGGVATYVSEAQEAQNTLFI